MGLTVHAHISRKRYRSDLAAKGYLSVHEVHESEIESKKKRGTYL